jgi:hypothetical protein
MCLKNGVIGKFASFPVPKTYRRVLEHPGAISEHSGGACEPCQTDGHPPNVRVAMVGAGLMSEAKSVFVLAPCPIVVSKNF